MVEEEYTQKRSHQFANPWKYLLSSCSVIKNKHMFDRANIPLSGRGVNGRGMEVVVKNNRLEVRKTAEILVSIVVSAATTIVITAIVKKELMNYVEEMCEINIKQAEKIKDCAISNVEKLTRIINQNKPE